MEKFDQIINIENFEKNSFNWHKKKPFPHFVVDNFFHPDVAKKLENDFPEYDDSLWYTYGNSIEVKKVCNNWNAFPKNTYLAFSLLNSLNFVNYLQEKLFSNLKLYADPGLNGGGWHIHSNGGKLNTHLDYSIHPKLFLQRKININIYLNSNWKKNWGGGLGLWGNESKEAPGPLEKEIEPKFNRAVVFDTTCNSWHGLPTPLTCPKGESRKSLAVCYLSLPIGEVDSRGKALFAPTDEQKEDSKVLELIKLRADTKTASKVYKK